MPTRSLPLPSKSPFLVLGLAALLLTLASACGTSVPTQPPPVSSGSPTPVRQDLPTATPHAQLTPPLDQSGEEAPDLEATVQARVAATVEAMQPPDTTPGATQPVSESQPITTTTVPGPESVAGEVTDSPATAVPGEQAGITDPEATPENPEPFAPGVDPEPRPEPAPPTVAPTPAPTATPTPTPTPTPIPTPTPTPTPTQLPPGSSRDNSIPLGQSGVVQTFRTSWELSVVSITPDAWEIIRERNSFNQPPDEGKQFYLLRLRVKNVGEERAFFVDYVKTTGEAAGWVYTTNGDSCGVIPDDNSREVFPGGEFELNVCWHVATADLPTLIMFWDESPTPNPVWFDLR